MENYFKFKDDVEISAKSSLGVIELKKDVKDFLRERIWRAANYSVERDDDQDKICPTFSIHQEDFNDIYFQEKLAEKINILNILRPGKRITFNNYSNKSFYRYVDEVQLVDEVKEILSFKNRLFVVKEVDNRSSYSLTFRIEELKDFWFDARWVSSIFI